ncbi:HpcH/HpaI aldolase/citrate lyase family protein [Campylobacter sp. RM12920]|uniref:HpcH/HpaI aldolase/citrate lyase family protein n=1 Tax=Campylobacter californiensis TaxID=1032243 RepID=A0ABD4JJ89_9BACT|nr:HpcH/HpaI aldolase/citrate lyase family protein [Campylobacter sp. RM12919]MBE2987615.1 HpcH/HpaI aldolase/citrate lyase family protein [Campylobacter sp. RM12920]
MAMVKDYLKNSFKENINAGNLQFGVAQEIPSAEVAEVLATTKYDWLFVDGEHGAHDIRSIVDIARAIAPYDMTPVVRIPQAGTGIFKQLLDSGIQNIIIPKVESGEEAEQIMYWASYPPRGNRGMGAGAVRAARYGRYPDYLERIEKEICILPQIESKKGIENLEAIATTPGIGGVFLGPIDLAVDMGHGLNIFHPEVVEAMKYAIKRIRELGVPVGTIAVTPEQVKEYDDMGVSFLGVGVDTLFLANSADSTLETFKSKL